MYAMTAAHATLPIPSYARVTNLNNGQSVLVRVNDRGPFHPGRIIDLSYTAAYKLDVLKEVTPVEVELVSAEASPEASMAQTEAPIIEAPAPKLESVAAGEPVYLQLGAFANPDSADALLHRASTKLSRDFPGVMRLESGKLHKVQAGPFMSVEAADRAAALISDELDVKPIKVVVRPAASAPRAPVAVASAPGLYLQLAALSSSAAAEALGSRVKAHFGDELPGVDQVTVGPLIKVQAGPFVDAGAAERLALAYQREFGVKPYKVRR